MRTSGDSGILLSYKLRIAGLYFSEKKAQARRIAPVFLNITLDQWGI